MKKRLEKARGKWVDELPTALWAYRTTYKSTAGHTPFSLAYGTEAIIPVELEIPSHWVTYYDPKINQDLLLESLDFVDEKREEADLRAAATGIGLPDTIMKKSSQEHSTLEILS